MLERAASTSDEIKKHMTFVRRIARDLVGDVHLADELSQSAMVAALEQRPEPERGMRAWFVGVVRNLARSHYRSEARRGETSLEAGRAGSSAFDPESPERSALDTIQRGELSEFVVSTVMQLDEPYRAVVLARYLDEKSPPEIALHLDRPLETVQTQLRRGLAKLRASLDAQHKGGRDGWMAVLLPLTGGFKTAQAVGAGASGAQALKAAGAARMPWLASPWSLVAIGVPLALAVAALVAVFVFGPRPDLESPLARATEVDTELAAEEPNGMQAPEARPEQQAPTEGRIPSTAAQPQDELAAPEASATPTISAAPAQTIRVVEKATGRAIVNALVMTVGINQAALDEELRRVKEQILKGELPSNNDIPTNDESLDVRRLRTDASGEAPFVPSRESSTQIMVMADGFVKQSLTFASGGSTGPLVFELDLAGGLELVRGDAPAHATLTYHLTCDVLGEDLTGTFVPGETKRLLPDLSSGLYDLRVTLQPPDETAPHQTQSDHRVAVEEGTRNVAQLWTTGEVTLAVELAGTAPLPTPYTLKVETRGTSFSITRSDGMREVIFNDLPLGRATVSLLQGGEHLASRRIQLTSEQETCRFEVPSAVLGVEFDCDDPKEWRAILHGPLTRPAAHKTTQTRILFTTRGKVMTYFQCLRPGEYDIWMVGNSEAIHRRVTIPPPPEGANQTIKIDRPKTGQAHVSFQLTDEDPQSDPVQILTKSGIQLSVPGLDVTGTYTLPPGGYTLVVGLPESDAREHRVQCRSGDNKIRLSPPLYPREIHLRAHFVASNVPIRSLLLSRASSLPLDKDNLIEAALDQSGQGTTSLTTGVYIATDPMGRNYGFVLAPTATSIDLIFE